MIENLKQITISITIPISTAKLSTGIQLCVQNNISHGTVPNEMFKWAMLFVIHASKKEFPFASWIMVVVVIIASLWFSCLCCLKYIIHTSPESLTLSFFLFPIFCTPSPLANSLPLSLHFLSLILFLQVINSGCWLGLKMNLAHTIYTIHTCALWATTFIHLMLSLGRLPTRKSFALLFSLPSLCIEDRERMLIWIWICRPSERSSISQYTREREHVM